jgi:8-oxo-dGTP pyrophosphatase MutT (NUDIX family)
MVKRAIAVIIIRDGEIGCFTRSKRTYRSGELDAFMGGEVKDKETPYKALEREMKEKVYFQAKKITNCGNLVTINKVLSRTIFILNVDHVVEPVFAIPLPNDKYTKFEWMSVNTLKEIYTAGLLNAESLAILNKANVLNYHK